MKAKIFLSVLLLYFICCTGFSSFGQSKTDSLSVIVGFKKADTNTVNAYADLCREYGSENFAKAIESGQRGLLLAKKIGFYKGAAKCLTNTGLIYYDIGNFPKATGYILKSLKVNLYLNNHSGIAVCYNAIGNIYFKQGNYAKSMVYYLRSLKIRESDKDKKGMAACYNNIGSVYTFQKNYPLALKYFKEAIKISIETGNRKIIASSMMNTGIICSFRNHDSLALKYFLESLKFQNGDDNNAISTCLNNIGSIYRELGNYKAAYEYLQRALQIRSKINDKKGLTSTLNSLARLEMMTGKYAEAIEYALLSFNTGKEINALENIKAASEILAGSYSYTGNYTKAYYYQKCYSDINDSIFNITSDKQIKEVEAKYQSEKKENEIELLNKEKEIQSAKLKGNRILQFVLFGGIILIIVFFILIYNRYKISQQDRVKTELLKQQEKYTRSIIETQEQERTRIARDLHDGIGQTMACIISNYEQISNDINLLPEEKQKIFHNTSKSLDEAYKELRAISHLMMPRTLKAVGLSAAISDLLDKTFANTPVKYSFEKQETGNIPEDTAIGIYRIFQELLSNIIKHSHAEKISVELLKNQDNLILIVEDDGIGISQSLPVSETGKEVRKPGIGLINITARAQAMKGTFFIEPASEKGMVATVIIPVLTEKQ